MLKFEKRKHRHTKEIPLAPVLDLLTVVVFFLVLSSTFEVYKKNVLPPAQITKTENNLKEDKLDIPLNPKILIVYDNEEIKIKLRWFGKTPGLIEKRGILRDDNNKYNIKLKEIMQVLLNQFVTIYPNEKSIQLGFSKNIYYQEVLSAYDGVSSIISNVVLMSDQETQTLYDAS